MKTVLKCVAVCVWLQLTLHGVWSRLLVAAQADMIFFFFFCIGFEKSSGIGPEGYVFQ